MTKDKLQRHSNHTVSRLTAHIVWVTKYRKKVLQNQIKTRTREIIIQICESEDINILGEVVY